MIANLPALDATGKVANVEVAKGGTPGKVTSQTAWGKIGRAAITYAGDGTRNTKVQFANFKKKTPCIRDNFGSVHNAETNK